jgi:hypothetical protein
MQLEWIHSDSTAAVDLCVKVHKISAPLLGCKIHVICQAENLLTGLKSEKSSVKAKSMKKSKKEEIVIFCD